MFKATNLTLAHGRKKIVHEVNLAVNRGEVVALCGPNGAGKSTLLAAFSGDMKPVDGGITLDGANPREMGAKELATKRAVLEQSPSLTAAFTTDQLVRLSIPLELSPRDTDELVDDILSQVGLSEFQHRPVHQLSGGQQHRAHLARTLCQLESGRHLGGGDYLLLDEPTASLDIAFQISAMEAAYAASRRGSGVLVVLHDLNLAAAFADRIGLMANGKMITLGTPGDVLTSRSLSDVYGARIDVDNANGRLSVLPVFTPRKMAAE